MKLPISAPLKISEERKKGLVLPRQPPAIKHRCQSFGGEKLVTTSSPAVNALPYNSLDQSSHGQIIWGRENRGRPNLNKRKTTLLLGLRNDLSSLHALLALLSNERDGLALLQDLEAGGLDGLEVDKQIGAAGLGGDEAVTLLIVEPLDGTGLSFSHFCCCERTVSNGFGSRGEGAAEFTWFFCEKRDGFGKKLV